MRRYTFTVKGRAQDDQTWSHSGVLVVSPGSFKNVIDEAMRQAHVALTKGRAQVGQVGVECRSPYQMTYLTVEEECDDAALPP